MNTEKKVLARYGELALVVTGAAALSSCAPVTQVAQEVGSNSVVQEINAGREGANDTPLEVLGGSLGLILVFSLAAGAGRVVRNSEKQALRRSILEQQAKIQHDIYHLNH